jgi:hypothetical protein
LWGRNLPAALPDIGGVLPEREFSTSSPEVGRTLLQAGLWAATGTKFPIERAGIPDRDADLFRQRLLQRAVREKMMPMLAAFSQAHDLGLGDVPQRLTEVYRLISREEYVHLRPAMDALAARDIPVILIKGADLDLEVYERKFPRVMGDIDLLVRPPDVPAVIETFQSQGFTQGRFDRKLLKIEPYSPEERAEMEDGSIELVEFSKLVAVPDLVPSRDVIDQYLSYWRMVPLQDAYFLVIGYDAHIHLSLDLDLEDAWANLRTIDFPETGPCLAQSFTDMLWYLSARLYHELHMNNAAVMRAFIDVLLIVHTKRDRIDWDRIVSIARRYKLHPSLYYTLWHVDELLPGMIPAEILGSLDPAAADERGHDWGDFMPKFLGGIQISPILT